jgi:hypothetical protein
VSAHTPTQGETNVTVMVSLRAVALVGRGAKTIVPDPIHGRSNEVGRACEPYWVNVTVDVGATLVVTKWATIV